MKIKYKDDMEAYDREDLLNQMFSNKLTTSTFLGNTQAVDTLCDSLEEIEGMTKGHMLLVITQGKLSKLYLIDKGEEIRPTYKIYTWDIEESIEKEMSVRVHQTSDECIREWIETDREKHNATSSWSVPKDLYIIQSLTGYTFNKNGIREYHRLIGADGVTTRAHNNKMEQYLELTSYARQIIREEHNAMARELNRHAAATKCEELQYNLDPPPLGDIDDIVAGKVGKIINTQDLRLAKIDYIQKTSSGQVSGSVVARKKPGVKNKNADLHPVGELAMYATRNSYRSRFDEDDLEEIPYNYLDDGRPFIAIPRQGDQWNFILGSDPRVRTDAIDQLKDVISRYLKNILREKTTISAEIRVDQSSKLNLREFSKKTDGDRDHFVTQLRGLRRMTDEYKYLIKKKKSDGEDIKITDNIIFRHAQGKIEYNDFSVQVDDEMVKSHIFQSLDDYRLRYFRGELTEEEILNRILDMTFDHLSNRVQSYTREATTIKVVFNDVVKVDLDKRPTKGKAVLVYLNGQRFNKNEIIMVLRELSCCRDNETARMFIRNIGKLGLSVYIGITSGYVAKIDDKERLYRFRKEKGRSNYSLILDDLDISIIGKKIINILYSDFIGEYVHRFESKIKKTLFASIPNIRDYAKYKLLIDSAYESFKNRSKEFLEKKVKDVDGEFCKYYNKANRKLLDAIKLTGMSGKEYTIAYDSKDSYVFMSAEKNAEKECYENGTYICMIDQSNIKSNIGYDTVISKLLALKSDSVIASTIYNLEEELDEEERDDNDRENDS